MADASKLHKHFFQDSDLTLEKATAIIKDGLNGADYGEFYQEIKENEQLIKDKGEFTTISFGNSKSGFGFRVGQKEHVGYAFCDDFNEQSLHDTIKHARQILKDGNTTQDNHKFGKTDISLYPQKNPMSDMHLSEKIEQINKIEEYANSLDDRIANVTIQYGASSKDVHIITADGQSLTDTRPTSLLSIQIMLTDENGESETGYALAGGHDGCCDIFDEKTYKKVVNKALKQADTLLIAEDAPAGVMDVVLSNGWSAVLLHEAIGHGLEGDFNRKDISVYSGKIGEKIAADEVTVIDQGDMAGERGSLHFDDEGIATQKNILIKDGVLMKYMQDRQNAQLMNDKPTGNGRRESYRHTPMPRMTNTYFKNGTHDPKEIIKSVKNGLYISDMGGGQVDITSGNFNMNATLAYRIRDGKICEPVKGATLVGDGLTVIQSITMVGNDLELEKNAGHCGKNGQSVIVGCGQPTIRVSNMTVGGIKK